MLLHVVYRGRSFASRAIPAQPTTIVLFFAVLTHEMSRRTLIEFSSRLITFQLSSWPCGHHEQDRESGRLISVFGFMQISHHQTDGIEGSRLSFDSAIFWDDQLVAARMRGSHVRAFAPVELAHQREISIGIRGPYCLPDELMSGNFGRTYAESNDLSK